MLLTEMLSRAVQLFGNDSAISHGDVNLTYRELDVRVKTLAAALQGLGLRHGDHVAILANNGVRYMETYLAIPEAGLVLAPINIRLAPREAAFILADGEVKALLIEREFLPLLAEIRADLKELEHVVLMDGPGGEGMHGVEALMSAADPAALKAPDWSEDDMVFLCYTGGTTGLPKGVMMSHRNVIAQCLHTIQIVGFNERTVWTHVCPMFHAADYWSCFAITAVGGLHVFQEKFDPRATLELIQQRGVTHILLVPTMINMILETPGAEGYDLSSLTVVMYGSAPMPEERLKSAMALFGPKLQQLYGQTETAPFLTATAVRGVDPNGSEAQRRRMMSCGQPILGVEVKVVDGAGNPVKTGEAGEIVARGPNVMLGYWKRPQETAAALRDGWIHTGDIASMDEDRYLYIMDRAKDLIITGAENVYCPEVENALYRHPDVLEAAVIGVPDDTWGEAVKAIVVRAPGKQVSEQALMEHCREWIAGFKIPKSIDFVDTLPRSGVGKVLKHELRKPYWKDQERAVH